MAGNKGIADAIVVSMGSGKKEPEAAEEKPETSELEMAASEILDAVEASDASALSDALESFIKLCKYESEEGE